MENVTKMQTKAAPAAAAPPIQYPTSAPIVKVTLGGSERTIIMGFRAYKKLEINPFKSEELLNFIKNLDVDKAAAFVQAGMENAAIVLGLTTPVPTIDEVIDMLDVFSFSTAMAAINQSVAPSSASVKTNGAESPHQAQVGSKSGPSGSN